MWTIYLSPLVKRYSIPLFSISSLIVLAFIVGTFVLPWFFAYISQSFWLKENYFREQPAVAFTHQYVIQVQGINGQVPFTVVWSSNEVYNQWLDALSRPLTVQTSLLDTGTDGIPDVFDFEVVVPVLDTESVQGVGFAFEFQYELTSRIRLSMKSLAVYESSFPMSASQLSLTGDLTWTSRIALPYKDAIEYRSSPFNFSSLYGTDPNALTWNRLLFDYSLRDYKTELSTVHSSWSSARAMGQPFKIKGRIYIPQDRIFYQPGPWEVLKNGWIQYLSYLTITLFFSYFLLGFILKSQIMPSTVHQPWQNTYGPLPDEPNVLKSFVY